MKRIRGRERRHKRIKKKTLGTPDSPRMVVYRSLKGLHVQLVNDIEHKTILSVSTISPELKKTGYGGNKKAAERLGEFLAKKASTKGIKKVQFDRSGYMYHGRIKALAESALKNGLTFGARPKKTKQDEHKKPKHDKHTKREK